MVLTSVSIMTHIGFAPAAIRNAIIADFIPTGLEGLLHLSDNEVKDACTGYACRQDVLFPVILTVTQRK